MPQFLLRQKYVFILVCTVLVILSTSIFLIGEKHFNINQGDIQAFVLTDEQLITEHNEEFYRKIINNSEDEFVIVESDVIIKFASSKWEKEMGFKEEDILGKNFFSYVNPQDLPFIANSFIVVLDNKEINENIGPFRLNDKNEESKLYMATAIPIFNEKDKVILIALVLHDISNPLGGKDEKKELSEFNRQELEKLITMEK
jgi:PAS domain S-box-containing protein